MPTAPKVPQIELVMLNAVVDAVFTPLEMEICVDSPESAKNAIEGGATRLEVCSALSEGGLTPTAGLIKQIRSYSSIPIYAMLRVRCGNFIYSKEEMDAMLYDLKMLKTEDINGFVFGALTPDSEIDASLCEEVLEAARPLPVTFHRAFDEAFDPIKSLEVLVRLGFERILTSGQKYHAEEGLDLIGRLVRQAHGRIKVMPGSGISRENIAKIRMLSGASEFHASAKKRKCTAAGQNKVKIGAESQPDHIMVTDPEVVKEMVKILSATQ